MTTIEIYGRSRFKFAKLFPEAKFEGYECNIRYCYFSFKNKISLNKLYQTCELGKITIIGVE